VAEVYGKGRGSPLAKSMIAGLPVQGLAGRNGTCYFRLCAKTVYDVSRGKRWDSSGCFAVDRGGYGFDQYGEVLGAQLCVCDGCGGGVGGVVFVCGFLDSVLRGVVLLAGSGAGGDVEPFESIAVGDVGFDGGGDGGAGAGSVLGGCAAVWEKGDQDSAGADSAGRTLRFTLI
jgi:hypothetical protein